MTTTPNLINCKAHGCTAEIVYVPERAFPDLCIEHAHDLARIGDGWTVDNSQD